MFKRINIIRIIIDHFRTLRKLGSSSRWIHWKDMILFIFLPLTIAVILSGNGFSIVEYIGNLIAAISIFGGFLFNLLAIIYSQIDKIKTDADRENDKLKKTFVKEIHINISYAIVLSLLIVVVLISFSVPMRPLEYGWLMKRVSLGLIYFLLGHFLLTLLMVLNRVYILLKKEAE